MQVTINGHTLTLTPAQQFIQFSPKPVTAQRTLSNGVVIDLQASLCLLSQTVKIGDINHTIRR